MRRAIARFLSLLAVDASVVVLVVLAATAHPVALVRDSLPVLDLLLAFLGVP